MRVEVADAGRGFTVRSRVSGQDEGSGWGLHPVDALSDRWGAERDGHMRNWFEIDCGPPAAADPG